MTRHIADAAFDAASWLFQRTFGAHQRRHERRSERAVVARVTRADQDAIIGDMKRAMERIEADGETREALADLVKVIDAAGLYNLSTGVQLGPTVWYVKASDALERARAVLGDEPGVEYVRRET
jgi:hypothetical protein